MDKEIPPAKGQFYIKDFIKYDALNGSSLDINLKDWRLEVDGLVKNKLYFSYEQLENMANKRYKKDFNCVTKWSIKDVIWEGPSIKEILNIAVLNKNAKFIIFYSEDGYSTPVYIDDIDDESIIALKINGKKLSKEQGFPARPYIPSLYGWKSAKWLKLIFITDSYKDGYWERYGYHERGRWKEQERFENDLWKRIKKGVIG